MKSAASPPCAARWTSRCWFPRLLPAPSDLRASAWCRWAAARRGPGAGPVHAGARSAGRLARGELSGHARSPEYKMISVDAASLRLTWLLFQPRRVYEASRWAEENLGTGLGDSGRPAGQRMEPGENSP